MIALVAGAATYAFRLGPTLARLSLGAEGGRLSRFLQATGVAAIATLFVASVLPELHGPALPLPLLAGTGATLGLWVWQRSVVLATLGGALAYALAFAGWG